MGLSFAERWRVVFRMGGLEFVSEACPYATAGAVADILRKLLEPSDVWLRNGPERGSPPVGP